MDKNELLQELMQQFRELHCVALPVKRIVLHHAQRSMTPEGIRTYLEQEIVFLKQYVASINDAPFLQLCREGATIASYNELLSRFEVPEREDDIGWLVAAELHQRDRIRSLYCLTQYLALPLLQLHRDHNLRTLSLIWLTEAFRFLGRHVQTVELLEGALGLRMESYTSDDLATHLEQQIPAERNHGANLLSSLADALGLVGRHSHAAAVLEAFLELKAESYSNVDLVKHLETRLPHSGNNAANLLRTLAHTYCLLARPGHAVAVLEAFLCLRAETYNRPELAAHLETRLPLFRLNAANLLSSLADALRLVGRPGHAAAVLEAFLCLRVETYSSPDLAVHLEQYLPIESNNTANLLSSLADALRLQGRPGDAAAVLEAFLDLRAETYASPEFAARLQAALPTMRLNAGNLLRALGNALRLLGRDEHATVMLEVFLGLRADTYTSPELAAHLESKLSGSRNNDANLLSTLADSLRFLGRHAHAATLIEAFLGLRAESYASADLAAHLKSRLPAAPVNTANLLRALAEALMFLRRQGDAASLLEAFLNLRKDNYANADLAAQLERHLPAPRNNAANLLRTLAESLALLGRQSHAVALLEALLGLDERAYASPELDRRLKQCLPAEPGNAASVLRALGDALSDIGRHGHAAALIEAFLDLRGEHYASPELAEHLHQHLSQVGGNAASLLMILTEALDNLGRNHHAKAVIEAVYGKLDWLDGKSEQQVVPENGIYILAQLLTGRLNSQVRTLELCRHALPYLRRGGQRQGMSPEDRIRFIQHITMFRHQVREAGFLWAARERDGVAKAALWSEVLRWDAELGQWLLLQRFLLKRKVLAGNDGSAAPVSRHAALSCRHRLTSVCDPVPFGTFHQVKHSGKPLAIQPNGAFESLTLPPWYHEFVQQLEAGVGQHHLADGLEPGEVFLRAGFTTDGQLVWNAFRCSAENLVAFAGDQRAGTTNDRETLLALVRQHDEALRTIWNNWTGLWQFGSAINDCLGRQEFGDWEYYWTQLIENAPRYGYSDLPQRVRDRFGVQLPAPERGLSESWFLFWKDAAHDLVRRRIDAATEMYLAAVAKVWNLDSLAPHLTTETDLVVQVDDVLHAVPVAYLPVQGSRLLTQAASVRTVFSPLISRLQKREDAEAKQRWPGTSARQIVISSFGPVDPAADGATLLHEQLEEVARRHGAECLHAFDEPPGSLSCLAAGLRVRDQKGVVVLIVCGHGDLDQAGVNLADGPWTGGSCDLSPADFLIQVSCSVGRNRQGGWKDVEGFCVELTVHRARSILAGKWRLHSLEAPYFAAQVVKEFLRGRRLNEPNPRARAVARTARHFLDAAPKVVGLNTLAAFELYGLG